MRWPDPVTLTAMLSWLALFAGLTAVGLHFWGKGEAELALWFICWACAAGAAIAREKR